MLYRTGWQRGVAHDRDTLPQTEVQELLGFGLFSLIAQQSPNHRPPPPLASQAPVVFAEFPGLDEMGKIEGTPGRTRPPVGAYLAHRRFLVLSVGHGAKERGNEWALLPSSIGADAAQPVQGRPKRTRLR